MEANSRSSNDYSAEGSTRIGIRGKGTTDVMSKENFGNMEIWMQEVEEAEEPSYSPRVLVYETGLMKSGSSARGAGSKAI